jgi:hypothetical protein
MKKSDETRGDEIDEGEGNEGMAGVTLGRGVWCRIARRGCSALLCHIISYHIIFTALRSSNSIVKSSYHTNQCPKSKLPMLASYDEFPRTRLQFRNSAIQPVQGNSGNKNFLFRLFESHLVQVRWFRARDIFPISSQLVPECAVYLRT